MAMPSDENSKSTRVPETRPSPSLRSEMLTPSEIKSLRQNEKKVDDYARKAFAHLRPKP